MSAFVRAFSTRECLVTTSPESADESRNNWRVTPNHIKINSNQGLGAEIFDVGEWGWGQCDTTISLTIKNFYSALRFDLLGKNEYQIRNQRNKITPSHQVSCQNSAFTWECSLVRIFFAHTKVPGQGENILFTSIYYQKSTVPKVQIFRACSAHWQSAPPSAVKYVY